MKKLIFLLSALFFIWCCPAIAGVYSIDPDHAEIGFSVKHMVITNVRGAFREYKSSFEVDPDNKLKSLSAEITVKSIDTRIRKRDDHLQSTDFFDASKFPVITFSTTSVEPAGGNTYRVTGLMKIKDITQEIMLEGELNGPIKDPWGNQRMGIVLMGRIDRRDFDVTYNKVLETGGLLIDNEVKVHLEGEGVLQK